MRIKSPLISTLAILLSTSIQADVFFSEYQEGNGSQRFITLFNASTESVVLSPDYILNIYQNGAKTATQSIELRGIIEPQNSFRIAHRSADISAEIFSGDFRISGDDTLILTYKGETIDRFGQIGTDPGIAWESPIITTRDAYLTRKKGILTGDKEGHTTFNPEKEWQQEAHTL